MACRCFWAEAGGMGQLGQTGLVWKLPCLRLECTVMWGFAGLERGHADFIPGCAEFDVLHVYMYVYVHVQGLVGHIAHQVSKLRQAK